MASIDRNGICLATVEEFAGCLAACRNAAAVLGCRWAVIPRQGAMPGVAFEADLLVLSSWDERYQPLLDARVGPIVPRWHSTILQTELSDESAKIAGLVALRDSGDVPAIAVNDPDLVTALDRDGIVFLPDVFTPAAFEAVAPSRRDGVNVSLFGAAHWRKNLLVQSVAFNRARLRSGSPDWTLHLNGQTRRDDGYAKWLRATRVPFVDHGWLDRGEYLSLVAAMDVGLCATLCESYCYVAADHVALGVPIVASTAIRCLDDSVARVPPDAVEAIAAAMADALDNRRPLATAQRHALEARARANADIASRALDDLVARAARWSAPSRRRPTARFRELTLRPDREPNGPHESIP